MCPSLTRENKDEKTSSKTKRSETLALESNKVLKKSRKRYQEQCRNL